MQRHRAPRLPFLLARRPALSDGPLVCAQPRDESYEIVHHVLVETAAFLLRASTGAGQRSVRRDDSLLTAAPWYVHRVAVSTEEIGTDKRAEHGGQVGRSGREAVRANVS